MITKQLALATLHKCMVAGGDFDELSSIAVKSEVTDAEAIIGVDHDLKVIFVIHSGSDSPTDFILDAKFHKNTVGFHNDKKIRIHSGFSESEWSIHDKCLYNAVQMTAFYPEYALVIGGHSLGKASSELFAFRLPQFLWCKSVLIGFGGPDVGNDIYVEVMRQRFPNHFCFENNRDDVPKLLRGRFNYAPSGIRIELHDKHGSEGPAKNLAAAIFNHDTARDYQVPITELPGGLNDEICEVEG